MVIVITHRNQQELCTTPAILSVKITTCLHWKTRRFASFTNLFACRESRRTPCLSFSSHSDVSKHSTHSLMQCQQRKVKQQHPLGKIWTFLQTIMSWTYDFILHYSCTFYIVAVLFWYPASRQDLHVWVHIKQSPCQTTLSCRRLHPLTFELRQRWQLHRGALGAVLGRALGSPLPLGLPHRLLGKAVHLLGGGDCRHFWRRRRRRRRKNWQRIQTSWCVLGGGGDKNFFSPLEMKLSSSSNELMCA